MRLLMVGGLHPVRVPGTEEEALRDLVRAREDVRGDLMRARHRFQRAGQLMSFLGVVPSENSSWRTRRQGAITKSGSRHARRLLVEADWHYRRAPAKGLTLSRRQEGQPQHVIALSWKAQQRLHRTWRRLDSERGKRRTIVAVAVAVARELAGFCWAIANTD